MTEARWDTTPSCDIRLGGYLKQHGKSLIEIDTEAIESVLTELASSENTTGNVTFHIAHPEADENSTYTHPLLRRFIVNHGFTRRDGDRNAFVNINCDFSETDESGIHATSVHELRHAVEIFETPWAKIRKSFEQEAAISKRKTALWSSVVAVTLGGAVEVTGQLENSLHTLDHVVIAAGTIALGIMGYRWGADGFAEVRQRSLHVRLKQQSELLAEEAAERATEFPSIITIS